MLIGAKKPAFSLPYVQNGPSPPPPPKPSRKRYNSSPELYTCKPWAFPWGFLLLCEILEPKGSIFLFKNIQSPTDPQSSKSRAGYLSSTEPALLILLSLSGRTQNLPQPGLGVSMWMLTQYWSHLLQVATRPHGSAANMKGQKRELRSPRSPSPSSP